MNVQTKIIVNDRMQSNYTYELLAPIGKEFSDSFSPHHTPQAMLEMGVFEGRYLNDCISEFPAEWFRKAKLSPSGHNPDLNFFGVRASKPLSYWVKKAGFTRTTRGAGSSGIAVTTSDAGTRMINAR